MHTEKQKKGPESDVSASLHDFLSVSANRYAYSARCVIFSAIKDVGARGPVNDLGNAACHFIFSFHFLTACSWYDFSSREYECVACMRSETYPITP